MTGRASVTDGDTIEIHGERIRFNGIDAPESAQTCEDGNGQTYRCGARAADALDRFLAASSPTRCDFVERDRYERFVGDCYRSDGASVSAAIVAAGWAMDWPRYSGGAYAEQQDAANALEPENRAVIARRRDEFQVKLSKFFAEGMEDGSIRETDPRMALFLFMGAVNWLTQWFRPEGDLSGATIARQFADLLDAAIKASAPGNRQTLPR